jgi:hypothetical protein
MMNIEWGIFWLIVAMIAFWFDNRGGEPGKSRRK